jgi:hypothetical protein
VRDIQGKKLLPASPPDFAASAAIDTSVRTRFNIKCHDTGDIFLISKGKSLAEFLGRSQRNPNRKNQREEKYLFHLILRYIPTYTNNTV